MIETTVICKCDRCKVIINEHENMYKISRTDVPKYSRISPATYYSLSHDGIVFNMYDQYKACHICEVCSKELFNFMENTK